MTREEARKAAEVMLAFANGEEIEYADSINEWVKVGTDCAFNWFNYVYRVKPKEKFDPKTLHHYDRVVVRDRDIEHWGCSIFSHIVNDEYLCIGSCYKCCIPYNDDTKHLVGTNEDAPEYYKYWED